MEDNIPFEILVGADNIFKTVILNKFLAGNITVMKRSLFRFKTNYSKSFAKDVFIEQERKLGD